MFLGGKTQQRVVISPQMSLAILQFLTTTVRPFFPENCSQRILRKLFTMDVFREIKLTKASKITNGKDGKAQESDENEGVIMRKGSPCDFFVLIIEGRVEVSIGKENKSFQEGPFSYFGEQMLEQAMLGPSSPMISNTNMDRGKATAWVPDYTLKAITDVVYLKVRQNTYMVAITSCRMNNMNSESDSYAMRESDIEDVLANVTENDVDFKDHALDTSKRQRNGYHDADLRTNSLKRCLSSLSKSKIFGRSTDSLETKAISRSKESLVKEMKHNGKFSVPLRIEGNMDDSTVTVSDNHKTVISIGKEEYQAINPTDRTSLLKSEHSLS